jgi:L-lactate utilization protein LutB
MEVYKCVNCGIISPLVDGNGQPISAEKACFKCGCTEKVKVIIPNQPQTKSAKRRRFSKGGGGSILRIGL